jgi:hypothetical protein
MQQSFISNSLSENPGRKPGLNSNPATGITILRIVLHPALFFLCLPAKKGCLFGQSLFVGKESNVHT